MIFANYDPNDQETVNASPHSCTYCDESFVSRSSLVQHLHIHIGGNVDQESPQTICPVSSECLGYDGSKESLSSHIISCHPDQARKFQLEPNSDFSTTLVNDIGPLEKTFAHIPA